MKLNSNWNTNPMLQPKDIAAFGEARLVRKRNGDFLLIGGDTADRFEANEWVRRFVPEAAISSFQ